MRDSIGEQRAAARERDNALVVKPNALQQDPQQQSWFGSALSWSGETLLEAVRFWKLFGL